MPKVGRSEREWQRILSDLAKRGDKNLGRGQQPGKGTTAHSQYLKILQCPSHGQKEGSKQAQSTMKSFFTPTNPDGNQNKRNMVTVRCTCGFHNRKTANATGHRAQPHRPYPIVNPYAKHNAPKPAEKRIYSEGCQLPKVPNHKEYGVAYCRDNPVKLIHQKGYLDLLIFAPLSGHCPRCKSGRIKSTRICTWAKFVYSMGWPLYCLGIDVDCMDCGKSIKSIDSRYVQTLPLEYRLRMPFIQTGQSHGVDKEIIRKMRTGTSGTRVASDHEATVRHQYEIARVSYETKATKMLQLGQYDSYEPFPDFPKQWAIGSYTAIAAFLRDYEIHRPDLYRELQTVSSVQSLAVDHQAQVVKRVKATDTEIDKGNYSFVITGDLGVVLNYCVVPDTGAEWTHEALDEVCQRFQPGQAPEIVFVDCGCCNGKLRSSTNPIPKKRQERQPRLWETMLEKKLDALHLMFRITREANAEHPRHAEFARMVARSVLGLDPECTKLLNDAREKAGLHLTERQMTADSYVYNRRTPLPGPVAARRLLLTMQSQIKIDKDSRQRMIDAGVDCDNITKAHPAYPIITGKVKAAILNQVVHCLNGCLQTDGRLSHVCTGEQNYRHTGIMLKTYASAFGTNRCETLHSALARYFVSFVGVSRAYFDARNMWKIIHYNRKKLRKADQQTIPEGFAPSEFKGAKIVEEGKLPPMYFGFDYCRKVLSDKNQSVYEGYRLELDADDERVIGVGVEEADLDLEDLEQSQETTNDTDSTDNLGIGDTAIDEVVDVTWEEACNNLNDMKKLELSVEPTSCVPAPEEPMDPSEIRTMEETAQEAAAMLKEKTASDWADDLDVEKPRASPHKNVARKRNLVGAVTYHPVTYNAEMTAVWEKLAIDNTFKKSQITRKDVEKILRQYADLAQEDSKKESGSRKLLPVGLKLAEEWLKAFFESKEEPLRQGQTSETAGKISNDVRTVLQDNTDVAPVVQLADQRLQSKLALILEDRTYDDSERLRPTVTRQCQLCGAPIGRGPGMHLKDECPKEPPERKAERERKKAERLARSTEYKNGLVARRAKAAEVLRGLNRTQPAPKDKVAPNCRKCAVCYFSIPLSNSPTLKPEHNEWHYVKNKQWLYCPFGDPSAKKIDILVNIRFLQKRRNDKYRGKQK